MAKNSEQVGGYVIRMGHNLKRVEDLIALRTALDGVNDPDNPFAQDIDDIVRSAIVLLHAAMEDFLRTVLFDWIPREEDSFICTLPLAGTPRSDKYKIKDLIQHRGKSIDTVLDESISQWLNQFSFNSVPDVVSALEHVGLQDEEWDTFFADLAAMMKRRHRIVHYTDLNDDTPPVLNPVDIGDVQRWAQNVHDFATKMMFHLQDK